MTEADRRARAQLWSHLRVLVLDFETTAHQRRHRIISGAAINLVAGRASQAWHAFRVNPGVPIDPNTQRKHNIRDDEVENAPSFAGAMKGLLPHLQPRPHETLVLVAHNVGFDIPVLRYELERAGQTLRDLPVLDTMGELPDLVRFTTQGRKLEDLLTAFHITNHGPHTALGDANATAAATIALLNMAADAGYMTPGALLAKSRRLSAQAVRFSRPLDEELSTAPVLSEAHLQTDAQPLLAGAKRAAVLQWLDTLEECARLRCPNLADRVATAEPSGSVLLPLLLDRLRKLAADPDDAPVAGLLGGIVTRVLEVAPAKTGRGTQVLRTAALNLDEAIGRMVAGHQRCAYPNLCPACQVGEPCPLDVWRHALAPLMLVGAKLPARLAGFITTTGADAGRKGAFFTLRPRHPELADATIRLVSQTWRENGQGDLAVAVARFGVASGCVDPEVAATYAFALSVAGRKPDLLAGLAVCDKVLGPTSSENTDPAWRDLAVRRNQIAGRLRRLEGPVDAAGNPVRRHHPTNPHRSRPPRFLRTEPAP